MHSPRCTERQDVPVAGSCVSCSDPHCLWHVPHVIPAWQTQSTFELTSTAGPAEHVANFPSIDLLSDEEQGNILPYTSRNTTKPLGYTVSSSTRPVLQLTQRVRAVDRELVALVHANMCHKDTCIWLCHRWARMQRCGSEH